LHPTNPLFAVSYSRFTSLVEFLRAVLRTFFLVTTPDATRALPVASLHHQLAVMPSALAQP
jgi:hypothetical protein